MLYLLKAEHQTSLSLKPERNQNTSFSYLVYDNLNLLQNMELQFWAKTIIPNLTNQTQNKTTKSDKKEESDWFSGSIWFLLGFHTKQSLILKFFLQGIYHIEIIKQRFFSVEFWMRHDLYNHAKISNRYVLLNSNNQNKEQEWKEKGIHVKTPHSILASLRSHLSGNKIYIYNKQ